MFPSAFAVRHRARRILLALFLSTPLMAPGLACADDAPSTEAPAGSAADADNTPTQLDAVSVIGQRFERARNDLSPSTGSSEYLFERQSVQNLAQGDHTPLNQVLMQAPGVAGDNLGQLHVRGDHADLQYRIDGLIVPEGISGFGQVLDTRFADKIDLLTGALPAQYGYRTAGVIDITPRKSFDGGQLDLYGGSHDTINPSGQFGYNSGGFSAYGVGSYLSSKLGVESPTSASDPLHDRTTQGKGFTYLSYVLSPTLKLSGIIGSSYNKFEIPNNPGQAPNDSAFAAQAGVTPDSSTLNQNQFERNNYALVALRGLGDSGQAWQLSLFDRQSQVNYQPDPLGDLVFNGVSATILRKSNTAGLQGDLSIPLGSSHTLRSGIFASTENDRSNNTSQVFQTSDSGGGACPPGSTLSDDGTTCIGAQQTIVDNNNKTGNTLLGLYVQDQWDITDKLTLNYGLRFDRVDAFVSATQWSPRLGMIWYATPETTLHAGYARYLTPPPNELISNATLAKFTGTTNEQDGPNSPVQAERSNYFDVGVTHRFTTEFNVGLDNYYKEVRELLDEGQFGPALIFTPFNYAKGKVYGSELSASWHHSAFSGYANVALSRALGEGINSSEASAGLDVVAYTQGNYIHLDHDQFVSGSAGASYIWQGTTFSLTDLFAGGLRTDANDASGNLLVPNGLHLPFYNQLDAGIQRTVDTGFVGPVGLRLAAINILDRVYEIRDGGGVGVGAPAFGPRASVYAGISKSFGG